MMRSYEECRQEILRRAEARIHKRRKLKKQLLGIGICAACFALCLGVLLTGRYEAPPQLEAKGQSAVKEGAVFDAPICDLPVADAPAAAAPTMGTGDEPADAWDCIVTETPAQTQSQQIPDQLSEGPEGWQHADGLDCHQDCGGAYIPLVPQPVLGEQAPDGRRQQPDQQMDEHRKRGGDRIADVGETAHIVD